MTINFNKFEETMQDQFKVYYSQMGNTPITLDALYNRIETAESAFRSDMRFEEIGDNDVLVVSREGQEFNKMSEEAKLTAREKCQSLDNGKLLTPVERGMFVKAYLNEMKDLIEVHNLSYGVGVKQKM